MIRIAALSAMTLLAAPAHGQDAASWLQSQLGYPTDLRIAEAETVAPEGALFATDPITLWRTDALPLAVPTTQATPVGLVVATQDGPRGAAFALVWSEAPVACGIANLAIIGVDSGLAAFMAPQDVADVRGYLSQFGQDDFALPLTRLVERAFPGPVLVDLVDRAERDGGFPVMSSGWGDGGYPVSALLDADGNMLALFVQFIRGNADWLQPPPCESPNG